MYKNRVNKPLALRDEEIRRASTHTAGHYGVINLRGLEDEERARAAMRIYPSSGIGHARNSSGTFQRTESDRVRGKDVTERFFPLPFPLRPLPGAGPEAIKAWNDFVKTVPAGLLPLIGSLPRHWLRKRQVDGQPYYDESFLAA